MFGTAIIACLVIALYTGRKPSKATLEMLAWHLSGRASEAEVLRHLEGIKKPA